MNQNHLMEEVNAAVTENMESGESKAVGAPLHRPVTRGKSTPHSTVGLESLFAASLYLDDQSTLLGSLSSSTNSVSSLGHKKLDRSQSEPADKAAEKQAALAQQQAIANASRYKTELCRPFEENGTCKYGDKCQFAHGYHELRNLQRHPKYKTELCRTFHTIGFCPYGPRCHFVHNADEVRPKSHSPVSRTSSAAYPLSTQANGSTADSPSPPSSLGESPDQPGTFFPEELTQELGVGPFSPVSKNSGNFQFGNEYLRTESSLVPTLGMPRKSLGISLSAGAEAAFNRATTVSRPMQGFDTPSPVDSMGSDLDRLSLDSGSPTPPSSTVSSAMDISKGLRLPLFTRLSDGPC
ncbi:mRNA decay activator protein ZFP36L2-A-like isoform X2 [Artemia franciscana]|uniref:C3H1-type domain-containing protein n=1 Tax=Artemia franciscana TaxID=6661 RepID=A0AA88KUM3_ARTSF|nr:hypothetical protein QYM36_015368 [Artemia franciscana]KAK2707639.1 hypothetical protein QYM36_015368 [Artemia franciscana]KAK2707644.1 hypothetical protein QYM36_015368 [Artemia franciscana]